jgi:F0F1-type ATP synthase assembly protein I
MKDMGGIGILFELGLVVALGVLIPLGLGLLLDHLLSTSPLFILIGALVGIIMSTAGVVRVVTRSMQAVGEANTAAANEESDGKEDRS